MALASDRRYLDALAVVDDPAPAYRQVAELTEPAVVSGRSHAGFNPPVPRTRTVPDGAGWRPLLRGFRNADIRAALYGSIEDVAHAVVRAIRWPDAETIARTRVDREATA